MLSPYRPLKPKQLSTAVCGGWELRSATKGWLSKSDTSTNEMGYLWLVSKFDTSPNKRRYL